MRRPPATHWEKCRKCKAIFPAAQLESAADIVPAWKRGWVCAECAEKLQRIYRPV